MKKRTMIAVATAFAVAGVIAVAAPASANIITGSITCTSLVKLASTSVATSGGYFEIQHDLDPTQVFYTTPGVHSVITGAKHGGWALIGDTSNANITTGKASCSGIV